VPARAAARAPRAHEPRADEPRAHATARPVPRRALGAVASGAALLAGAVAIAGAASACSSGPSAPRAEVSEATQPATGAGAGTAAAAAAQRLSFGPSTQSKVEFVGAKVTASHAGSFERFSGTIELVGDAVERSKVSVEIEIASLAIEPERLRGHLLTSDLLDAEAFPKARFESTAIAAGGEGGATHTVTGNLTLHGQTKQIRFPATIAIGPDAVTARAEFVINRKDFGIVYPGMPDDLIRDDVTIKFDIRAPRS
jgi:polyisoprenoid-binding protein YceI